MWRRGESGMLGEWVVNLLRTSEGARARNEVLTHHLPVPPSSVRCIHPAAILAWPRRQQVYSFLPRRAPLLSSSHSE
eukprot:2482092-Amphidinium_carterae.2